MHGTRAVQKMIECLSSPSQVIHFFKVIYHLLLILACYTNKEFTW
jgi:hypothetical protein